VTRSLKANVTTLGKISVRQFKPQTAKPGAETAIRKRDLYEAFVRQNPRLGELRDGCRGKRLSLDATFHLNQSTPDKTSYKKDLDNLLKILMDVIKEEMDDNEKKTGLGIVMENRDEEIFEIACRKEFVSDESDEGIDLIISEWEPQKESKLP